MPSTMRRGLVDDVVNVVDVAVIEAVDVAFIVAAGAVFILNSNRRHQKASAFVFSFRYLPFLRSK